MSYVVSVEQMQENLTPEEIQIHNDHDATQHDKESREILPSFPTTGQTLSSPASLALSHMHTFASHSRLGAMTKAFTPPNSNYYYCY